MPEQTFRPGLRLSVTDVLILLLGGVATDGVRTIDRWLSLAIAFVVLHFFLFCNVLRMSRPFELLWAGVFVAFSAAVSIDVISWPSAIAASFVLTILLGVVQSRRPSYHGVGWRRLNPGLPEWWQSSVAEKSGKGVLPG